MATITNKDLRKKKYSIVDLEKNINNLCLWEILLTQVLTADFCFTYFWDPNDRYAKDKEDKNICDNDVLNWQPHLTINDLNNCRVCLERIKNYKYSKK